MTCKFPGRIVAACLLLAAVGRLPAEDALVAGWQNPPNEARLKAYWWWLNGNVTKESITRDLEEMKAKGFGGAVLFDANGAAQDGNAEVPHGPTFFTPEWRALYLHTLQTAQRLGLEISLNIQSGWNLGGPVVTADDAAKQYAWSELVVDGGTNGTWTLPQPKAREGYYRDAKVVAYPLKVGTAKPATLKNWKQKALQESLQPFSAPDSAPLFAETAATPGEEAAATDKVIDLTAQVDTDGVLRWQAPAGVWQVLRLGYTIGDHAYVSTSSDGWAGYALDVYSATAFQRYWDKIVEPLIQDAGPLAGTTLKYLHTDSWEVELANWTPNLPAEFKKRRGYEVTPWLPVLAGRIIQSREASDRFLFDYRRTLGDLAIDGHYRLFRDNAHKHGLGIHPESGGPHAVPIDAQQCLGWDDAPMSEFWAWSWTHRIGDGNRFFVKQPASAAHTYGHKLVMAEGFTTIGPHWQERIWENLKPSFDKALCEGLNQLVWHAFVNSPDATGVPGQQYFAGSHLNPKSTWWAMSGPFFDYIDRCQFLLQQGGFCADVLYYYGDQVPNFTQHKRTDPAHCQPGYDYDVITAEALLERTSVKQGRIVLPDGMNYRALVLPDRTEISLPVLRQVAALVAAGATVIGPRPLRAESLEQSAAADAEVQKIAAQLWGGKTGRGRVIANRTVREVLAADGVGPDCTFTSGAGDFDYIHRATDSAEIYFVANRSNVTARATVSFRCAGKIPELWDPVSGRHQAAARYTVKGGVTQIPLEFTPCGSWFVVFRQTAGPAPGEAVRASNQPVFSPLLDLSPGWQVHFDPRWGGPAQVEFPTLTSWTKRAEPGIKYYSGTATYEKSFNWTPQSNQAATRMVLDLGEVRELAAVTVNGQKCGISWCPPFRVDITSALKPGGNQLAITVVNFWPNRIIGDADLPEAERVTQTNIRKLTNHTALMESGLM
ncbi:MAG TPA: glycosyl hydrolase, partial [Verrucomicrobiae bacterium]